MKEVFEILDLLNIKYDILNHPAVFTVEEARKQRFEIEFGENKNLFLRNKKGNRHYLVTISASKQLDISSLANKLGEDRLGFASDNRLQKYLGLTKGSVSPFGLINDKESEVIYILDKDLLGFEKLGFHPNINTQTIITDTNDFRQFIESRSNKFLIEDL